MLDRLIKHDILSLSCQYCFKCSWNFDIYIWCLWFCLQQILHCGYILLKHIHCVLFS